MTVSPLIRGERSRGRVELVGVAAAVFVVCMVASNLTQGSMANLPLLK
jgi:hypothetical protein